MTSAIEAVRAVSDRRRWAVPAVAALASVIILWPLLEPGYVLSYDMVFVPRQPLRWDLVAPSGALPRAVPQDFVVSLVSLVAPGWLVQRAVLFGALIAAGIGAGRLVPASRLLTRLIATVTYIWTPFLAERLLIGQWGLLLAYAALPWLVGAAIGIRRGRPGAGPTLAIAAAVSAITPTGGLIAMMTVVALLVAPARRPWQRWRQWLPPLAVTAAFNAPWLIAALLAEAGGRSDPAGVDAFAAQAENWAGAGWSLLGTGGIWNAQVIPASRASALAPILTALVLAVALAGFSRLVRRWPSGVGVRLAAAAAGAMTVAFAGILPGTAPALRWMVGHLSGAGLLRDGQKFIAGYALLLVLCFALGAERLTDRIARIRIGPTDQLAPARARMVLGAALLFPVAVMPDLAFGGLGALRTVHYPSDWRTVEAIIQQTPGEVLCLPFSEYRSYSWNAHRIVIDPAPRYFPAEVLSDDTLRVGDLTVVGENPRAARVRDLLARGAPIARTGVRWVVVQHDAGGVTAASALDGLHSRFRGDFLDLYENPVAGEPAAPSWWRRFVLGGVHTLVLALLIAAIWRLRRASTTW